MSPAPVLTVRGLVTGYGDAFELRIDALDLRAGEVLAVLGPNGAGKSTLLRAMSDLLPLRAGRVDRDGSRAVALVFQRPVTLSGSVAYNTEVPLWARGVARAERRRRAAQALERFGIGDLAHRAAGTLSGGETRRLALARAFATEPDVLLLDEPFDDLDSAGQEALTLDLRRTIDETGVAVVMVTHELRHALLLADRIAVLEAGRCVQQGSREELLRRPASVDVARLLGMANLVPGTTRERDPSGLTPVALADAALLHSTTAMPAGRAVWAGVRPEHVKLEPASSGAGRVTRLVSDGMLVTAWVDWQGTSIRTHLIAGRGLGRALKLGDHVAVEIPPEDVHLIERA